MTHPLLLLPDFHALLGPFLDKEDIFSCIRVSKAWHASFYHLLYRDVSIPLYAGTLSHTGNSPLLPLLRANARWIKNLAYEGPASRQFYRLGPSCCNVKSLELNTDDGLLSYPSLAEETEGISTDEEAPEPGQPPSLEDENAVLSRLVRQNPSLSNLRIKYTSGFLLPQFWDTVADHCQTMDSIMIIDGFMSTPDVSQAFWRACRPLRSLSLAFLHFSQATSSPLFPPSNSTPWFTNLQELELMKVSGLGTLMKQHSDSFSIIGRCPNLRKLIWYVYADGFPAEEFAVEVLEKGRCKRLEALKVDGYHVGDAALARVLRAMDRVTALAVPGAEFGMEARKALQRHHGTLTQLRLFPVSNEIQEELMQLCPAVSFHFG